MVDKSHVFTIQLILITHYSLLTLIKTTNLYSKYMLVIKTVTLLIKLPAWKTFKNADDWILPAGFNAKHWNIPESIVINPNIFKLVLKN